MKQEYSRYSPEDHGTWQILYDRQMKNLPGKAYPRYLDCVKELLPEMNRDEVVDFRKVIPRLKEKNGWDIKVVKGLIPVEDFFGLLAERRFCSSTWLRSRAQLDYLEEPDMFHDTFGHLPLLMDPTYAAFMEEFGKIGVRYLDDPIAITALQRLYWFTIEFGLIRGNGKPHIYGAGILSSFGEVNHIYESDIEVIDFDLEKVIHNHFINSEIQMRYYLIEDFKQLYDSLSELNRVLEQGLEMEVDIVR
ncbi:MAG: phenylalanine 4-monooxygenase [Flavobacteriales bacterium]|nr:phenylalanine 4-monooxygenase [Flavobacteriales bacterium]NNK80608.1 phenylalanine 4-monooxygenase [Flavobacteriales bacterium]